VRKRGQRRAIINWAGKAASPRKFSEHTAGGNIMRVLLLCLLALVAVPAHADDTELKQKIVGTWKLVSVVYEDQESKARTPVYGEHPRGRQIATADGLWLALVTAEGRTVPKTDEERAQALRTMIAYTGRYRVEDGKVVTKVEAAWNEGWVGGEQTRLIRFEGDRLFIESPPMPHPNQNNRVVRVIVIWDRER
jgi:Lipocalin-like domain